MPSLLQENETLLLILGVFSVVSFIATLIIVPWIVIRLPKDYFSKPSRYSLISRRFPAALRLILQIAKNCVGLLIVALGIVMLVMPGQGLLTILIGLILIDFPGKYKLQRNLIQRKPVARSVNWMRKKGGEPPLEFGSESD